MFLIEVWPECGTLPPYPALMDGIIARIIQLRQDRKRDFVWMTTEQKIIHAEID